MDHHYRALELDKILSLLAAETREEINRKGAGRPFEHAYRVYIHKGGGK